MLFHIPGRSYSQSIIIRFMGEIIKGPWGAPIKENGDGKPEEGNSEKDTSSGDRSAELKPEDDFSDIPMISFDSGGADIEVVIRMLEIRRKINRLLQGFPAGKRRENVHLRRQQLKDWTTGDIRQSILDSSDKDWKVQPSYYLALIEEYTERARSGEF